MNADPQTPHRILVYAEEEDELDALTARLDADGYSATGTVVAELAVDLASASHFDALMIGRRVSTSDRLTLTSELVRRNPGIVVVRANGPEAVITQLRQAFSEHRAGVLKTQGGEAGGGATGGAY